MDAAEMGTFRSFTAITDSRRGRMPSYNVRNESLSLFCYNTAPRIELSAKVPVVALSYFFLIRFQMSTHGCTKEPGAIVISLGSAILFMR
jgi:hypothetical protein